MSQRQRDVITLYYEYNTSQREIAKKFGINQSNVSVYLNKALEVVDRYYLIIYKSVLWGMRYGKAKR